MGLRRQPSGLCASFVVVCDLTSDGAAAPKGSPLAVALRAQLRARPTICYAGSLIPSGACRFVVLGCFCASDVPVNFVALACSFAPSRVNHARGWAALFGEKRRHHTRRCSAGSPQEGSPGEGIG